MTAFTIAAGAIRTDAFYTLTGENKTSGTHSLTIAQDGYLWVNDLDGAARFKGQSVWTLTVNGGISGGSDGLGVFFGNGFGATSNTINIGAEGSIWGGFAGFVSTARGTLTNSGSIYGGTVGVLFCGNDEDDDSADFADYFVPWNYLFVDSNLYASGKITITNKATAEISGNQFGLVNMSAAPMTVTNDGTISGGNTGYFTDAYVEGDAIGAAILAGTTLTLTNNSAGVIDGAVLTTWNNNKITNAGVITGVIENSLDDEQTEGALTMAGLNLTNSGTIEGDSSYFGEFYGIAVMGGAGKDTLVNKGQILDNVHMWLGNDTLSGTGYFGGNIKMGDGDDTAAIDGTVDGDFVADWDSAVNEGGADKLTVKGVINGSVNMGGGANSFTNSGRIFGFYPYESEMVDELGNPLVDENGNPLVDENGDPLIEWVDLGDVIFGSGKDVIVNSGKIGSFGYTDILPRDIFQFARGDVSAVELAISAGGGNDKYTNTGTVLGFVDMGSGNDSAYGGNGTDVMADNAGSDTYALGKGVDVFTLTGTDMSNDSIDGGDGVDVLRTNTDSAVWIDLTAKSAEYILGVTEGDIDLADDYDRISGFEQVIGGDHNDILWGSKAAETLAGGLGGDQIKGLGGKDVLYGDDGADLFIFQTAGDSGTTRATRDVIMDFNQDQDTIIFFFDANTKLAGDQEFDYGSIEKGVFTKVDGAFVPGQLRYAFEGASTILRGDTNGDGKADFSIELRGHFELTSMDFPLAP